MQTEQEFQIDADWIVVSTNQMTVMVGPNLVLQFENQPE